MGETNEKIWCPLGGLSGFEVCPQSMGVCSYYKKLFVEYTSVDTYVDVYYCELVTASMLLNRCNGIVSAKSWTPKYPSYEEMRKYLYEKYFKHLVELKNNI